MKPVLRTLERALKAFADRSRLRILKLLQRDELCVCQIAAILGLDQSTVSRHLAVLRNAGIVEDPREGRWTYYRISYFRDGTQEHVARLVELLRGWLEEDERVVGDREKCKLIKQIPLDKLCADTRALRCRSDETPVLRPTEGKGVVDSEKGRQAVYHAEVAEVPPVSTEPWGVPSRTHHGNESRQAMDIKAVSTNCGTINGRGQSHRDSYARTLALLSSTESLAGRTYQRLLPRVG